MSKSPPLVGPEYFLRFNCIADHCEDTCCVGLKVPVDAYGYGRMKEALTAEGIKQDAFDRLVPLNPDRGDPEQHAFIQANADGRCPFLDGRGLCGVHRRHGGEVLANACSTFPRSVTRYPDRRELAGSLACPEVVRLALLTEEPLDPRPLPSSVLPRDFASRTLDGLPGRDQVRAVAVRLLEDTCFPAGSRLVFLGQLGHWLRQIERPGEAGPDPGELEEKLRLIEDRTVLVAIHNNFSRMELLTDKWIALFLSILEERLQAGVPIRLARLAEGVLESFGGPHARGLTDLLDRVTRGLESDFGARLERYFRRHAVSWWYRNPHTDSESLTAHAFKLAFRSAMLRVMLVGHPETKPMLLLAADPSAEQMDLMAVEVVQVFAKYLELSPELQTWTTRLSQSKDVFASLVAVAKLL